MKKSKKIMAIVNNQQKKLNEMKAIDLVAAITTETFTTTFTTTTTTTTTSTTTTRTSTTTTSTILHNNE